MLSTGGENALDLVYRAVYRVVYDHIVEFILLLQLALCGLETLLHLEPTALGMSVLMTGMPAGAAAAIFAAKYGSDAPFAAKNVVFTTLFPMLTLPLWAYFVG